MRSTAPVPPPTNISPYWTDQEVSMNLENMKQGHSIPDNVTVDVNPYQYKPSNLPDDIWYLTSSGQKKDSEHGFWKARGDPCKIFMNSTIIGWRTTLEFFEGQAPNGRRTDWLMQEYSNTRKDLCIQSNSKESSLLCRVFRSSTPAISDQEVRLQPDREIFAGGNHSHPKPPDTGSVTGLGYIPESQVRNRDENRGPVENIPDNDYISRGDFLELDDLADPGSRSFSSDNTSCVTLTSEECFDSLALLQDLDDEIKRDAQGKHTDLKLNVARSTTADEVVMKPATLASLNSNNRSNPPARAAESQKAHYGNEGTSSSRSSNGHKEIPEGHKNASVGRMRKLRKKYLCFIPF